MGLKVLGPVVGSPLESGFGAMEALWREMEIQFGTMSQVLAWSPKVCTQYDGAYL
jgi:hypothetical protein